MKYKISIDQSKCANCAACVSIAGELFEDYGHKIDVLEIAKSGIEINDKEILENINMAKSFCPNNAIKIDQVDESN